MFNNGVSKSGTVAGAVFDILDFMSPMGLGGLGFVMGLVAGIPLGRHLGFDWIQSIGLGIVGGLYVVVPGTELIPAGTAMGLIIDAVK